jgi:hypothetical protein
MQQPNQAQNPQPQEQRMAGTMVQRILGLNPTSEPPLPSRAEPFEDPQLDERVRASGEW